MSGFDRSALLSLTLLVPLSLETAMAQDETAEESFTERARTEAETYKFSLVEADADSTELELQSVPVLRWTNPVTGSIRGRVFLWTAGGRPELIASIYEFDDRKGISVECHSLSEALLTGKRNDGTTWTPQSAGVKLQTLDQTPRPAKRATRRLIQMRAIAEKFSAQRIDPDGNLWNLRLMRQPLYRYQDDGRDLIDGAVFCFAQGTNPDVILLLEARLQDGELVWQYGLARMHQRTLNIQFDGVEVATFDQLDRSDLSDKSKNYYVFRRGF